MKKIFNSDTAKLFYKKILPFSGAIGALSDVASPLASFSNYLTLGAGIAAIILGVYWIFIRDKSKEWSIDKGFMPRALVYAGLSAMVFGLFAIGQAFTGTDDRGMIAQVVPGIAKIQESVFRIEKTTAEMNEKLDRIEDNIDRKYSLKEMKILIDQEMWDEAITHLEDTPPLQRDEQWKSILYEVAVGWLYDMEIHEDLDHSYKSVRNLFQRFKVLKKSPEAMKYRKKIGLRYIDKCLSDRNLQDCESVSNHFIRYDRRSVEDLGFAVGKLTTYHRLHRGAIPYFALAVNEDTADQYCSEERLHLAIQNGFYGYDNSENMKQSIRLANLCFDQVKDHFMKHLNSERTLSSSADRVCQLFQNNGESPERCANLAKVKVDKISKKEAHEKKADARRKNKSKRKR